MRVYKRRIYKWPHGTRVSIASVLVLHIMLGVGHALLKFDDQFDDLLLKFYCLA